MRHFSTFSVSEEGFQASKRTLSVVFEHIFLHAVRGGRPSAPLRGGHAFRLLPLCMPCWQTPKYILARIAVRYNKSKCNIVYLLATTCTTWYTKVKPC